MHNDLTYYKHPDYPQIYIWTEIYEPWIRPDVLDIPSMVKSQEIQEDFYLFLIREQPEILEWKYLAIEWDLDIKNRGDLIYLINQNYDIVTHMAKDLLEGSHSNATADNILLRNRLLSTISDVQKKSINTQYKKILLIKTANQYGTCI